MYSFKTKVRVRYAETDKMGYCYYGNYATYFEIARVEALRNLGVSYKSLEDEGLGSMGAIARADEIERMWKAEAMKKIGKSKGKNKRQRMIDAYNEIIRERNKKADGGEVSLTVIEIPDISGAGVETLFKKR